MTNHWDDYAAEWDSDKDANTYSKNAYESLLNVVPIEGRNIFDFGCGTGLLTGKMSPLANQIVALDSSPKMISVLIKKKLPNVTSIAAVLSEDEIKYRILGRVGDSLSLKILLTEISTLSMVLSGFLPFILRVSPTLSREETGIDNSLGISCSLK